MTHHEPILRDKELNRRLFEDGYVTFPYLNNEEVQALKNLFWENHSEEEVEGLYVSSHYKNKETVKYLSDSIHSIFKSANERYVENGMTLGGTFISKPGNQTEVLHPHQDWSIVDESRFRSFTIWVPLSDVDESSGCMYVLPGSNNTMRGYRHVTIPSLFGQIYDTVWPHMKSIRLKAGEAIIFDHAIGHASKPNTSDHVRIAATHSLISKDPDMRFYWNNNGTVEEFVGENEYYNTEFAKTGPGHLEKIRDLDFEIHQLSKEEFYKLAGVDSPQPQKELSNVRGVMNWIKKTFN
ncbi:MAG: hypothetical protein ACI956_001247 [Nonlabens sp.]|jgi:hypothetical protein